MKKFVSLRSKILLAFTLMFTVFGVGIYYWFYRFTTEKILTRLKEDLRTMVIASSQQINVKQLQELIAEGKVNGDGRSDDPRYVEQLHWLAQKNQINPKIFLFTFTKDNTSIERKKIRYLVDVWMNIDTSKSVHFLESAEALDYHLNTLTKGTIEFRDTYKDKWGEWITYYAPIRDEAGVIVAGIGADMQIDEITKLKDSIRQQFFISFGLSYPLLLTLIYIFTTLLTRRFQTMQKYAQTVGEGNYQPNISLADELKFTFFSDEREILSKALEEMTEKIRQREELLNGIFNQVAVGIAIFNPEFRFEIVNETLCHLLGYSEKELLGKNFCQITVVENSEQNSPNFIELRESLSPLEKRCINKNGEIKWFQIAMTIVMDNDNNIKQIITVFQDISRRKEAENQLIESATKDFLTKLPNRAYFMESLDKLIEKSQQEIDYKFALLLVDLDDFKTINDSLGHLVGDQFLINIASHLRKCVTDKDIVARLGGDEFAILLTSFNSLDDVITVANNIQKAINFPISIYNQEFFQFLMILF